MYSPVGAVDTREEITVGLWIKCDTYLLFIYIQGLKQVTGFYDTTVTCYQMWDSIPCDFILNCLIYQKYAK